VFFGCNLDVNGYINTNNILTPGNIQFNYVSPNSNMIYNNLGALSIASEYNLNLIADWNGNNNGASIVFGWSNNALGQSNNRPYLSSNYSPNFEWMRLQNGNLGIGTANPQYTLDVNGTQYVSGQAYFRTYVGIGASNPMQMLQIANPLNPLTNNIFLEVADGGGYIGKSSLSFNGYVVGNNKYYFINPSKSRWTLAVDQYGSSDNMAFEYNPPNATQGVGCRIMTFSNVGSYESNVYNVATMNVGIGTSTPAYTLDVNGSAHINNNMIVSGQGYFGDYVGIGTSNPMQCLQIASPYNPLANNIFLEVADRNGCVGKSSLAFNGFIHGNDEFTFINPSKSRWALSADQYMSDDCMYFEYNTPGASWAKHNRFMTFSNVGSYSSNDIGTINVGIGTNIGAPAYTLDVAGTIRATDLILTAPTAAPTQYSVFATASSNIRNFGSVASGTNQTYYSNFVPDPTRTTNISSEAFTSFYPPVAGMWNIQANVAFPQTFGSYSGIGISKNYGPHGYQSNIDGQTYPDGYIIDWFKIGQHGYSNSFPRPVSSFGTDYRFQLSGMVSLLKTDCVVVWVGFTNSNTAGNALSSPLKSIDFTATLM